MKLYIKKILIIFLLYASPVFSEQFEKISVVGNSRVSTSTIENIINFKRNKNYTISEINNFQKLLFESNFFEFVEITSSNGSLKIKVKEYPIIDFFYIKGIVNKGREEFINNDIELGQNKIFSQSLLNRDIEKIKSIYRQSGYYNVKIKTDVSILKDNTINLILTVDRGEKFKVKNIYFIGNKFFNTSVLNDVVSSSIHGWWKFLSPSTTLSEERVNYDQRLLKEFYLSQGFYDVQITSSDINFEENNFASLTYSINSGSRYYFSKFNINDASKVLNDINVSKINDIIQKKLKNIYSDDVISQIEKDIYNYLNLEKIEFVKLNIQRKKESEDKISLIFNFVQVPKKYVNLINITGNSITNEDVIRRNLEFSEGDSFADYKLKNSERNISRTKIFKDIKPNIKELDNDLVDIEIKVTEQPTGSISAGVGAGSSGASVSSTLEETNLFGMGISTNTNLSIGTEKISGVAGFTIPDFQNSDNDFNYKLYVLDTDYSNAGYESTVVGNSASTSYELYEDINLTLGLGFDRDSIDTKASASSLYKSREGSYMTFKTFYNVSNDKRDRIFQPSKGHRTSLGQVIGLPGSDIPYLENNIYGSYYKTLSKNYILNLKAGAQTINSINNKDVKLSDRKFLTNKKLRGFESFGIGPKEGSDHIGGNYSIFSSISSTIPNPLPDKWNANSIIFLDFGNVWGVDYDDSKDNSKLRSSTGISLEWISPLGPLTFTLAETISSAPGDLKESFSFEIGTAF